LFSNIDNEFEKNGSLELTNNEANSEIVPKKDDEFDNDEYPDFSAILDDDSCLDQRIVQHKLWLKGIRHEQPSLSRPFKVGIYIRYFNQTRYENYLENHIKQFTDSVALCPNWTLVDFYIDEGQTAPSMENAPEWVRLLGDCFSGKVDLIITQKVSSVSRNPDEITFVSRILAAQEHPVGIYFISEDIYTLASYYQNDLHDTEFFAEGLTPLPNDELDSVPLLSGGEPDDQ